MQESLRPAIVNGERIIVRAQFEVGEGSVIDPWCYFSANVQVGRFCHVANGVSIAGGQLRTCVIGDYTAISSGAKIWCSSDDFVRDAAFLVPRGLSVEKYTITGDVRIGCLSVIGSNSVVMPDQLVPEGVAIGALSLVPPRFCFEPWTLYAGIGRGFRAIRRRDRDSVLRQRDELERKLGN